MTKKEALSIVFSCAPLYKENLVDRSLLFITTESANSYTVDVHEKHDARCGGDPHTAPRLFGYEVDKASGRMQIDDPVSGETRPIN